MAPISMTVSMPLVRELFQPRKLALNLLSRSMSTFTSTMSMRIRMPSWGAPTFQSRNGLEL